MFVSRAFFASDARDFFRGVFHQLLAEHARETGHCDPCVATSHVSEEVLRARCACSRHVACNMVDSAPVDDG